MGIKGHRKRTNGRSSHRDKKKQIGVLSVFRKMSRDIDMLYCFYFPDMRTPWENEADKFALKKAFSAFTQSCMQNETDMIMLRTAFDHWMFRPGGIGMQRARTSFVNRS